MMRRLFLLAALLPLCSLAADYTISSGTSTVNCNTFCSGTCQPGDTLTMDGGARGKLTVQNCAGTSNNRIVLRNDPTASEPTVITASGTGTGAALSLDDVSGFAVDGTQKWVGAPAGVCGIDFDLTEGRTQCGIQIVRQAGSNVNSFIQIFDEATTFHIYGVEIDGSAQSQTGCCGIGMAMYDRSYDCEGGNGTTDTADCTTWREDIVIRNNYIHDTYHEGVYFGPNYMSNASVYDLPNRNISLRYNLVEDAGWGCLQLKTALEGSNNMHHNVMRRCGWLAASVNDFGHSMCVQGDGNLTFLVYNNLMEDCSATGLSFRSQNVTSSVFPSMTCEAYNNVIIRPGFVLSQDGISGTVVNNNDPPTMNCNIYNNTIVDASDQSVSDGNVTGTWTATDNILCGAPIDGSITENNNNKNACTTQGFTNYAGDDLSLATGSTNIDDGAGSTPPSDDYLGVTRPQGSTHDVGAYEFESGGGGDPSPQRGGFKRPSIKQ